MMTTSAVPDTPTTDGPGSDTTAPDAPLPTGHRARGRAWARHALLAVPIAVALIAFLVVLNRDQPTVEPTLPDPVDIASVSTETLESLVATYRDDPRFAEQMPGIELVLAERHFTDGAYDRAFELYAGIVEDRETQPAQFAVSLSRIAWIGWLSNGDTDAALTLLDQSLGVAPTNTETTYIKGQILWCGAGDAAAAADLFRAVLEADDLTADVRSQVSGDLEVAATGAACR